MSPPREPRRPVLTASTLAPAVFSWVSALVRFASSMSARTTHASLNTPFGYAKSDATRRTGNHRDFVFKLFHRVLSTTVANGRVFAGRATITRPERRRSLPPVFCHAHARPQTLRLQNRTSRSNQTPAPRQLPSHYLETKSAALATAGWPNLPCNVRSDAVSRESEHGHFTGPANVRTCRSPDAILKQRHGFQVITPS